MFAIFHADDAEMHFLFAMRCCRHFSLFRCRRYFLQRFVSSRFFAMPRAAIATPMMLFFSPLALFFELEFADAIFRHMMLMPLSLLRAACSYC